MSKSRGLRTKGLNKSSSSEYPLVSVITVVFNGEKHIEQTILSVINQTYPNVEYIIIDGASTDGTRDIIEKYEDKIDYWISEADSGIYDAMNKGIALSHGELIGIINSDDWYEDYAIFEVVKSYQDNPEFNIFHGLLRLWENNESLGIMGNTDLFLKYGTIQHPTCFVKKEIYEKYGVFNCKFKISSDYELILRFKSRKLAFLLIEKVLANFRNDGISSTSQRQRTFETNEIKRMYSLISSYQMNLYKVKFLLASLFKLIQ